MSTVSTTLQHILKTLVPCRQSVEHCLIDQSYFRFERRGEMDAVRGGVERVSRLSLRNGLFITHRLPIIPW